MSNNQTFTVSSRPSNVTPEERRRRLAQVYALLLAKAQERRQRLAQAAARAENGRQAGEVVKHDHILP